jgi:transketolase
MNIDPGNPLWPERDRLVLSKGHACPIVYAALAKKGYFKEESLSSLRHIDSFLQGHPDMRKTPGIDTTTGSLGHGLSLGVGMAMAGKLIDHASYKVYVILGDGELQEGLIWEAAMAANKYHPNNLIAFVDCNGRQSGGSINEIMPLGLLSEKWHSFGWSVLEIDGHDIRQILNAIKAAQDIKENPVVILAQTTKGKGVSYMENDNSWHQKTPSDEQMKIAEMELSGH